MNSSLKRGLILALTALGGAGAILSQGGCLTMAASASGADTAESEPFYYDLAPYGQWVFVSPWGWVWQPDGVALGFMPYTSDGQWVLTSYGWIFESAYPWAPVAYHYGRWVHHAHLGWLWWPDTTWSPAWVAWHCGGGYIGWRPLSWREGGDRGHRREHGAQDGRPLDPIALDARQPWTFVETVHFTEPKVAVHIVPMAQVPALVDRSAERAEPILGTSFGTGFGPAPGTVSAATGRELPTQAIRVPPTPPMRRGGEVPTAHAPLSRQHVDPVRPPAQEGRVRAFSPPPSRWEPAPSEPARPAPSYTPPPAARPAPSYSAPAYGAPPAARPPSAAMRPASPAPPASAMRPASPAPPASAMRPATPAPAMRPAAPPPAMRPMPMGGGSMNRPSAAPPPAAPNDAKKKKR